MLIHSNFQRWIHPQLTFLAGITYVVGLVGLSLESTRSFFISLSPLQLIFSAILLVWGQTQRSVRFWIGFVWIMIVGFWVEVLGVNTGLIFGDYWYGDGLGLKWLETPLVIGLNWAMLTVAVSSVLRELKWSRAATALTGGLILTFLDWLIEPVAPKLDFWYWVLDNGVPLQNYIAWFAMATTLIYFFLRLNIELTNRFAVPFLVYQGLFFATLQLVFWGTGS